MNKSSVFLLCLLSLLLLAFMNQGKQQSKQVIFTEKAPKPIGPYSQAIKVGNIVYVSGQIGLTSEGKPDTSSIENECLQAMKNVRAILEACGLSMDQVVKSTLYVKDLKNFSKINEVYGPFFKKDPPARETIQVSALPKGMNFEISVIAVE